MRLPAQPTMRTCAHCHTTFGPVTGKRTFCRNYCRTAAWRLRAGRNGGINKKTGEKM